MKKRFVVVGASAASIAFITKLRSIDKESEIVCITGEAEIPYNRCFLADYLSGDTAWVDMQLKPVDFFDLHGIDLRLGTWVTKIDTDQNIVFVGAQQLSYDYLFLGIGTKPFIPNIGVDISLPEVFTFHTADDINRLSRFIDKNPGARMAVIGAGLNGLECAASLHARGIQVTVIERNNQILPVQVDQELAEYIRSVMRDKGIEVICGVEVLQLLLNNDQVSGVQLQDGQELLFSGVVFATGSVVNAQLLQGTGIETQQGSIIVNSAMRTNIFNVYAGGDICMVKDWKTQAFVKSATWADAMLQGLCAATQFSDKPRMYPGYVGLRDSVFFGYEFYACGQTISFDADVEVVRKITLDGGKHSFYLKNGILIGFVLLGDVSLVAQYKQWYMTNRAVVVTDF